MFLKARFWAHTASYHTLKIWLICWTNIFELGTHEHDMASLLQLHWLLVQFKLCCLMHSVFYGKYPDYLANIAVFDLCRRQTSLCHGYTPSSACLPSHMPARLCGTHCRRSYMLSPILVFLENDSRHTFSVWRSVCADNSDGEWRRPA